MLIEKIFVRTSIMPRKKLRYAKRKAQRDKNKLLIEGIERLKSKDPREWWRRLYNLDPSNYNDSNLPNLVKNSKGEFVGGKEAEEMWMESFRKLGKEDLDFKEFDT